MADFAVRAAGPSKHVVELARTMFEAQQQAQLARAGHGTWVSWQMLPRLLPGAQEGWCAAAEAALAHMATHPVFPLDAHFPGGHCG